MPPMIITRGTFNPDAVAARLIDMGRLARSMPPSWDGARISIPVIGPGCECIGRVLPGRGLYLDMDFRAAGITKKALPFVYQRTPVRKLLDVLGDDRQAIRAAAMVSAALLFPGVLSGFSLGTITTYDGIIASRAGGKGNDALIAKASFTTVANAWSSAFRASGLPDIGTYSNIPGGAAPDRSNVGAWSLGLSNPTGGDKKYLLTFGYASTQPLNYMMLVDLLVAAGNILATVNTAQTINSTALTRYTTGAGVLMTFEVTTAIGTTASNLTVNKYTNQAGTTLQSTGAVAMTTSAIVQRLFPVAVGPFMQLAVGDFGVRSVEELTLSAAMTAGIFALNLYFPLALMPGVAANVFIERDQTIQIDGLQELIQTAGNVIGCLTGYLFANVGTSGLLNAQLRSCAG